MNKKKVFVLRDDNIISRLTAYLLSIPKEPLMEVVVREHQRDRSLLQNSLYWFWMTFIANEWGWMKLEVHEWCKRKFLVPIYERDDEGYTAMIRAIRKVHSEGLRQEAEYLADQVVKMTSTKDASVKQFAEYLTDICNYMAGIQLALPKPEDRYYDALMLKRPPRIGQYVEVDYCEPELLEYHDKS